MKKYTIAGFDRAKKEFMTMWVRAIAPNIAKAKFEKEFSTVTVADVLDGWHEISYKQINL